MKKRQWIEATAFALRHLWPDLTEDEAYRYIREYIASGQLLKNMYEFSQETANETARQYTLEFGEC